MLKSVVLEPSLDEHCVRLDVLAVDLDPLGVPAEKEGLVEGRASSAHRVEHAEATIDVLRSKIGDEGSRIDEQAGELLVGLSLVALDRHEVVGEGRQRHLVDRNEAGARRSEYGERARQVREDCGRTLRELRDLEREVVHSPNHLLRGPRGWLLERTATRERKLGECERSRLASIDAVARRAEQEGDSFHLDNEARRQARRRSDADATHR